MNKMNKIVFFSALLLGSASALKAQDSLAVGGGGGDTDTVTYEVPEIKYTLNNAKKYTIADIKVSGVENYGYQDYVLVGISGLSIGDRVKVPGDEIAAAQKSFWKTGLFSDVTILASRLTADSVWLAVRLRPSPVISSVLFHGVSKGEREELEGTIGVFRGSPITPNIISRSRRRLKAYFDKKSFTNAEIKIQQKPDVSNPGKIILEITVDKKEKVKISHVYIAGNDSVATPATQRLAAAIPSAPRL
ncbi:hypothetical protein AGMMS4957_10260 [Bacteroidia bacterium]|nr:hypothetical protein AGMMS4957_10260 [Bacteroidia bacterium]